MAHALLLTPVTYNTPSMRMGVAWNAPSRPVWKVHCGVNCSTFAGVICVSGL
jgi:hypothetical protein